MYIYLIYLHVNVQDLLAFVEILTFFFFSAITMSLYFQPAPNQVFV